MTIPLYKCLISILDERGNVHYGVQSDSHVASMTAYEQAKDMMEEIMKEEEVENDTSRN